jgi:hypothetical protein
VDIQELIKRYYTFALDEDQLLKMSAWMDGLPRADSGAVGGRFSFRFVPTSIALFITVQDVATGEELDLTNL